MIHKNHPAKGPVALGTTIRLPGQAPRHAQPLELSHHSASSVRADIEAVGSIGSDCDGERVSLCKRWPPLCGADASQATDLRYLGVSRGTLLGSLHAMSTAGGSLIFLVGFLLGLAVGTVL